MPFGKTKKQPAPSATESTDPTPGARIAPATPALKMLNLDGSGRKIRAEAIAAVTEVGVGSQMETHIILAYGGTISVRNYTAGEIAEALRGHLPNLISLDKAHINLSLLTSYYIVNGRVHAVMQAGTVLPLSIDLTSFEYVLESSMGLQNIHPARATAQTPVLSATKVRLRCLDSFTVPQMGAATHVGEVVTVSETIAADWIARGKAIAAPEDGPVERSIAAWTTFTAARAHGFQMPNFNRV